MREVERLEGDLVLARAHETLEAVREAMHADRNPETIAAYQAECVRVVEIRQGHRRKYPKKQQTSSDGGDGVATPDTVRASVAVHSPGAEVQQ